MKRALDDCNELFPRHIQKLILLLFGLTAFIIVCIVGFYNEFRLGLFLIWNMFLGGLPLVFGTIVCLRMKKQKNAFVTAILAAVWLFFFPNAPYMITDFIHLKRFDYFTAKDVFIPHVSAWFTLMGLTVGILVGCLFGYISLYLLQRAVAQRWGEKTAWFGVGVVMILTGIAIYMGRFMRFNTWDIVTRPFYILRSVWESLSVDTFALYMIFSLMSVLTYLVFYTSVHHGQK